LLLGVLSLPFIVPQFFISRAFVALSIYIAVVFMNYLSGDEYYSDIVYVLMDICQLLFYGGVCYYLINKPSDSVSSTIIFLEFFVIIFTSIATYYADMLLPNIVRTVKTLNNGGDDCTLYYRMGVCEYTMSHSLPALIAPLLLWIKTLYLKKWFRIMALVVLFFVILLVWTSAATTALLVMIMAIVMSITINPRKEFKKNFARILILGLLISPIMSKQVQLGIIQTLYEIMPDENNNKNKLSDFEVRIKYGDKAGGDLNVREDLYHQSLETFSKNIITGSNSKKAIGEHSVLMDRLAMLGIVGVIPLLCFFWYLFRIMYLKTMPNYRPFLVIGIWCFLAIYMLKNIYNSWLLISVFVLLPIMINMTSDKRYICKSKK
jgi:hypothetical protein